MTLDAERQTIRRELEALRANGARRQDLSLHACKRLFFDLGIRPSMATVRDLTQTGSASDIPKDIDHFWERIREASKIRVGAGAIPKALEEKAGELLGELFEAARTQARAALDDEREETLNSVLRAEARMQKAEILREAAEELQRRTQARAEDALARVSELEAQLNGVAIERSAHHENTQMTVRLLDAEKENLRKQLETAQATQAVLREQIDHLNADLRQSTEHYAQQIKDAIAEAERRVKPMLVELDSLRSMATTYQSGIRDASRKEFDFIQQLSAAKARSDRLDDQLRSHSEEIDALLRELDALRVQQGVEPALAALVCSLAAAGRLGADELGSVGTLVDGYVDIPSRCPVCEDGEPELSQSGTDYELSCPECEHSSGTGRSRLEAVTRFLDARTPPPAI